MREADADVASANAALTQALAAAGFSSASEVKTAIRTPAQQSALESQVSTFDQQRAGIVNRLAELEPQVAGREVSAEALTDVEAPPHGRDGRVAGVEPAGGHAGERGGRGSRRRSRLARR